MNFLEIYENACNTCGVRPNSLLLKTLREAPVRPITHLQLADNYVGPRGFLALVPLIEKCQTIESLDLRGNGLDNSSVIALCRVLRAHLGVHTVDLSRNPIGAEGGRHLLELLESNTRIVHLVVEQTDLFDAFIDRLTMAANDNAGDTDKHPQMVPSAVRRQAQQKQEQSQHGGSAAASGGASKAAQQAGGGAYSGGASVSAQRKASAYSIGGGSSEHDGRHVSVGSEDATGARGSRWGAASPRSSSVMQASASLGFSPLHSSSAPNLSGALRPKPPPPALASEAYSRLTKEQRELMKERYRHKAAVFTQVEQTASHKLAAQFRAELALLEGAQQRADYSRAGLHHQSPGATAAAAAGDRQSTSSSPDSQLRQQPHDDLSVQGVLSMSSPEGSEPNLQQQQEDDGSGEQQPEHDQQQRRAEGKNEQQGGDAVSGEQEQQQTSPTSGAGGGDAGQVKSPQQQQLQDQQQQNQQSTTPSVLVSVPMLPVSSPTDLLGGGPGGAGAALTPADHFRALFNQGCAYYGERNFQAAYVSWNEAVHVATQERNREWLTIVKSNLQNLAFEMQSTTAIDSIERGDLDEANTALDQALRLAKDARNAAWEAEVVKLRRNVLHSSFTRHHDRATSLLETFVNLRSIDVTDDTRFISPTGQLEVHSAAFVNEWTMLLIIKELMGNCVQSRRCAVGIGGNTGSALAQLVEGTVTTVSRHLIGKYWTAALHDPTSVAWLGTGLFARDERDALVKLWADMRGEVKELDHALWSVVELSQYGNLLLASYQLNDALDCFEKAAVRAGEVGDRFLSGSSLLFCGIVNLQRAAFARAESLFRSALTDFNEVRFSIPALRPPRAAAAMSAAAAAAAAAGGGAAATSASAASALDEPQFVTRDGPQPAQPVTCSVPIEDLCLYHSQAFYLLSRTLIGSYRYRDALEVHERFLLYQHHDVLFEKLQSNFAAMPTTDHLRAISASVNHPLVFYAVHYRHDWNLDELRYDVSEHIYSWIVVGEGDSKFNSVDVTSEFGVPSLRVFIDAARRGMYVDTNTTTAQNRQQIGGGGGGGGGGVTVGRGIVTTLNEVAWKFPLRKLYDALMHQVIDVLASHAAYSDLGMFTLILHGFLWLVPFPALLDDRDRFLIERITFCHALCASQIAMSQLSVHHLMSSNNTRNMVVKPPPSSDAVAGGRGGGAAGSGAASVESGSLNGNSNNNGDGENEDGNNQNSKNDNGGDDGGGGAGDGDGSDEEAEEETDPTARNSKVAALASEVLRDGLTQEQMLAESADFVASLGSGTLAMNGTSGDVLNRIAFNNTVYLCTSIVHAAAASSAASNSSLSSLSAIGGANSGAAVVNGLAARGGITAAMKGGIKVVATTFDTSGVLSCTDVAFASLPIETVVMPYAALHCDLVTQDATAESVLSLSRAFLGAGTVSVLFSLWQCSDVYPADFLSHFNADLQRQPNRAVALARAVRKMIADESGDAMSTGSANDRSRPLACFKPRRWASAVFIGIPELPRTVQQQAANLVEFIAFG